MTYIPNPTIAPGTITTAELGGDITTVAKTLLQQATELDQRTVLELSETSTQDLQPLRL